MYSTYNEGKSVAAERYIGTWKNKFYKYVTLTSKNVHVEKLDNIATEYSNTWSIIKVKPADV